MEIRELRIGSTVKYRKSTYKVDAIIDGGEIIEIRRTGVMVNVYIEDLEPVLIEEKHLIELGFENRDVWWMNWWGNNSTVLLEQEDNKGNEYLVIEGLEDSPEIKYVHHLQNILIDLS